MTRGESQRINGSAINEEKRTKKGRLKMEMSVGMISAQNQYSIVLKKIIDSFFQYVGRFQLKSKDSRKSE